MGRGEHVTAISAILNMTGHAVSLKHRKHPEYDRQIEPGVYRYPRGVTAPIKWESDPGSLIDIGGRGTMWQDNASDGRHVRFKSGGNPARANDGAVIYTRRAAFPGEQYLVLGIYPDEVKTLRSFTPGEALLNNLSEDVLNVLGVLKPADYAALAANPKAARLLSKGLETAARTHEADLKEVPKEGIQAVTALDPARVMQAVEGLSPDEQAAVKAGKTDRSTLDVVRKLLTGLGIAVPLLVSGICIIATLMICVVAALGPVGWVTAGVVAAIAGLVAMIGGAIGMVILLVAWVLSWFE